jgi:hypothetical protein
MHKRMRNGIAAAVTGTVTAGVLATGLAMTVGAGAVQSAAASASPAGTVSAGVSASGLPAKDGLDAGGSAAASELLGTAGKKIAREHKASRSARHKHKSTSQTVVDLPSGTATATSFWDPQTASGMPMSYETVASPYWPLGTKVQITCNGQSAVGVVEDFGPAEWAVAQHSPPAIVDLSEKMMADLTGSRDNSVTVHFQVLKMGHGSTYRSSGTGYDLAMGN